MDQRSKDFARSRLADPAWLVRANPRLVIASLGSAADRTQLVAAAVYRTSAHLHQGSSPAVRRQLLALDAARIGDRALAAKPSEVPLDGEPAALWRVRWVGGPRSERRPTSSSRPRCARRPRRPGTGSSSASTARRPCPGRGEPGHLRVAACH
jgi:hypothetical protein